MSLRDTMIEELRDLYSAENQLVKALPKLIKAADDEQLSISIKTHLEETKGHVVRLRDIFARLETKPTGKHCNGMEGLLEEGQEATEGDEEAPLGDIMIIGAASRVEHYEIAGYEAVIEMARALGEDEIAEILSETLGEEDATRELLTAKGLELIKAAASASDWGETEGDVPAKTVKEKKSARQSQADERRAKPELKRVRTKSS